LTIRDSLRFRALVYSPEYQELWGHAVVPMADNNKQHLIENTAKGFRFSTSVGGKVTGQRAHMVTTDDTLDATEAHSEPAKAKVRAHLKALSTRRVDPRNFKWINIGQRLAEDDAGGWCREQGFETLCLPTEFDPARRCRTSIGFVDWREKKGELLFPQLFGPEEVEEAKQILGPYDYSAQHQQLPVPAGGGILKNEWWKDYAYGKAPAFHTVVQFWDTAYTAKESNDSSAVTTWGLATSGVYLLDAKSFRLEMPGLLKQMATEAAIWSPNKVLIEAKANGLSVIQTLEADDAWQWTLVPITPTLDKTQRAHAVTPWVARGLVRVARTQPHAEAFMGQTDVFPAAKDRDLADSGVSGLLYIFTSYTFGEATAPAFTPEPCAAAASRNTFSAAAQDAAEDAHPYANAEVFGVGSRTGIF
jgi:predicted phage terminase large subunit-like protein